MSQNTALKAVTLDHPINSKIKYEMVSVTPEIASAWLGQNHGNRNQRRHKVDQYARDLAAGTWMTTGDPIRFDWNDRLIDGQHRLEAVVSSGVTMFTLVVRGLDPRVQDVLDQGAKRSAADALIFNGASGVATIIAAAANVADAVETGRVSRYGDAVKANLTNSEVLDWYSDNRDIEHAAVFASKIARKIKCTPSPLAYAIFRTEQQDATVAFNFFNDLSELRTNGKGDPRFALLDALRRLDDKGASAKTAGSQLSLIFRAWNAHRAGKRLVNLDGAHSDPATGRVAVGIPDPK
jgi:hypothetical protein